MSFFRQIEPTPPEQAAVPAQPAWTPPHAGELGGFVPLRIELARNDDHVVLLGPIDAHRDGAQLLLRTHSRLPRFGMHDEGDGPLRLGVEFADGRTTETALGRWFRGEDVGDGPILVPGGGGGGSNEYRQDLWLWPLPPPGPLTFHVVWADAGIPEQSVTIDAQVVLDAAAGAETLWAPLSPEEERAAHRSMRERFAGHGSSFTISHAHAASDPEDDDS